MNTERINIRPVQQSDLPQLIQLCAAHAAYEQASYDPQGKEDALGEQLFGTDLACHCLVVEEEGKLIGYATFMKQFSTWDSAFYIYMDCLFIVEAARGQGLGELLVNAIKAAAAEMGIEQIQWQTPEFNTRVIKFYKRIGATAKSKERFFLEVDPDLR